VALGFPCVPGDAPVEVVDVVVMGEPAVEVVTVEVVTSDVGVAIGVAAGHTSFSVVPEGQVAFVTLSMHTLLTVGPKGELLVSHQRQFSRMKTGPPLPLIPALHPSQSVYFAQPTQEVAAVPLTQLGAHSGDPPAVAEGQNEQLVELVELMGVIMQVSQLFAVQQSSAGHF